MRCVSAIKDSVKTFFNKNFNGFTLFKQLRHNCKKDSQTFSLSLKILKQLQFFFNCYFLTILLLFYLVPGNSLTLSLIKLLNTLDNLKWSQINSQLAPLLMSLPAFDAWKLGEGLLLRTKNEGKGKLSFFWNGVKLSWKLGTNYPRVFSQNHLLVAKLKS